MIETIIWCAIYQAVLDHYNRPQLWALAGGSAMFLLSLLFTAIWLA